MWLRWHQIGKAADAASAVEQRRMRNDVKLRMKLMPLTYDPSVPPAAAVWGAEGPLVRSNHLE
jgi:hypothetical protein